MIKAVLAGLIKDDMSTSKERMIAWNRAFTLYNHVINIVTGLGFLVALHMLHTKTSSNIVFGVYLVLGFLLMLYIHSGARVLISIVAENVSINYTRTTSYRWLSGVVSFIIAALISFNSPPFMSNLVEIGFLQSGSEPKPQNKQKRTTSDHEDQHTVGHLYI